MVNERDGSFKPKSVLTVHEVAEYLRLSDATIYQMARNGVIPVCRMGRSWRFKKDAIDDWLTQASLKSKENFD